MGLVPSAQFGDRREQWRRPGARLGYSGRRPVLDHPDDPRHPGRLPRQFLRPPIVDDVARRHAGNSPTPRICERSRSWNGELEIQYGPLGVSWFRITAGAGTVSPCLHSTRVTVSPTRSVRPARSATRCVPRPLHKGCRCPST